MSTIFKEMSGVDALPSQVASRSRIFNRPFNKTSFRSELMSQDCRLNMPMGSNSDAENNPEGRPRTPAVGSSFLRSQSGLNQDLNVRDTVQKSTTLRTFGLQSRISSTITPLDLEDNLRLNHDTDSVHRINDMPSFSKTFGLLSRDLSRLSSQNNERRNQELRRESNVNSSIMQRSLGLQTRNMPSSSHLSSQGDFAPKQDTLNYRRNNINVSAVSGTSGLNSDNLGSLNFHDNGNFNQNLKTNSSYSFNLPAKNLTLNSGVFNEGNLRLNQYSNYRNNVSTVSKIFGPAVRNTSLTNGFQMHDSIKCNDDIIDNDGFRRPFMPRVIRGRNSTLSSRLFHSQNTRHCQDLSNINGFNVSHISRRDMDTLSESRSALNLRSNGVDNQSIGESVISTTSVKSQFLNLLENLHHSILNIGPHVTAEAVRLEFDRAKQRLDSISEISFAPSVNDIGPVSVINQSSKYTRPPITESIISNSVNEGSLHLKSSKDLLKMIVKGKNKFKDKFDASVHEEEGERRKAPVIASSQNKKFNDERNSDSLLKTPKPVVRRKKISQMMKIETPQKVKNVISKAKNKAINLKQWYPIAVGSDLILCGVNEQGQTIKTVAVKKRLSFRTVDLINGLSCNLIGSPSSMVSLLPKKIMSLLKNGMTDRWRILQKELLNCQTIEEVNESRRSRNSKAKCSPEKKSEKTVEKKSKKESPKVVSTPKKRHKELHTRSGRTVKPPTTFWILPGGEESSSLSNTSETRPVETLSKKKPQKKNVETPVKKSKKITTPVKKAKNSKEKSPSKKQKNIKEMTPVKKQSSFIEMTPTKKQKNVKEVTPVKKQRSSIEVTPNKQKNVKSPNKCIKTLSYDTAKRTKKGNEKSPSKKAKSPGSASPRNKRASNEFSKNLKEKQSKPKSPKNNKKKENEEVKVHSSTEDGKLQIVTRQMQNERKRKVAADSDSNQAKEQVDWSDGPNVREDDPSVRREHQKKKADWSDVAATEPSDQSETMRHEQIKSKLDKTTSEVEVESTVDTPEIQRSPTKKGKNNTNKSLRNNHLQKAKEVKSPSEKKKSKKKAASKNATQNKKEIKEVTEFEDDFELKLNDIEIPEIANVSGNPQLSRSQLRLVSMETPPLKYFNNNLKLLGSATPVRSPDWCLSQRTESEVKQFQRRRQEALKKKITVDVKKTVIVEKSKSVQNKDLKRMMEWVSEKTVRSPQWNSKLLRYVIPSRRRMEEQDDEEEDEDFGAELL